MLTVRRATPICAHSLVLVVALALLAAACGSERDARLQTVLDDPDVASPLALLVGASGDAASDPAAAEEAVADCMARAGFEYEPITDLPGGPLAASSSLGVSFAPDLELVEAEGYGIAADLELGLAQVAGDVPEDPNDAIRAGLSADELARYEQALTGISPDEVGFRNDGTPIDPDTGEALSPQAYEEAASDGCAYQAYATRINPAASRLLVSDLYAEVQQLIQSDPQMLDLIDDWRRCMADAGYEYRNQGEIFDDLTTEGDDIYHEATEDHHDDVDPAETAARIDALREREIAIAVADWQCSQPLFEASPEITRRVETEFILANEDRLVDFLDADA